MLLWLRNASSTPTLSIHTSCVLLIPGKPTMKVKCEFKMSQNYFVSVPILSSKNFIAHRDQRMGEVKHVSVPGGVGQDKIQTFILK